MDDTHNYMMKVGNCRYCGSNLTQPFCDLGMSPLSNAFPDETQISQAEQHSPLRAYVCSDCLLVQLQEYASPVEIFGDTVNFSSISPSWLAHCKQYATEIIGRLKLDSNHCVIEVASNDGHMLKNFLEAGIPVLGVDPARNVAAAAEAVGIPTLPEFFGMELAQRLVNDGRRADLLIGNNVLAHVPALNDFVAGLRVVLKENGVLTLEFSHLLRLVQEVQFDTIYREHFSYFSLLTARRVLERHGLQVFDVEKVATHGGSLRVFAQHADTGVHSLSGSVADLIADEESAGLASAEAYKKFSQQVRDIKLNILEFFMNARRSGRSIVGYGAPARGNTLLNYCGIDRDYIDYTVDLSPVKQGKFLPGTHVPVYAPERINETRPDVVVILPWHLKEEIAQQLSYVREWGGQLVVLMPRVEVLDES